MKLTSLVFNGKVDAVAETSAKKQPMNQTILNALRQAIGLLALFFNAGTGLAAPSGMFGLDLPDHAVPDRFHAYRVA